MGHVHWYNPNGSCKICNLNNRPKFVIPEQQERKNQKCLGCDTNINTFINQRLCDKCKEYIRLRGAIAKKDQYGS